MKDQSLLTLKEAAPLLPGVRPETLRRWAKAGKVPYVVLPSGKYFFRREDIEALLVPVPPRSSASASSPDSAAGSNSEDQGRLL